jgi:hypothetical protein
VFRWGSAARGSKFEPPAKPEEQESNAVPICRDRSKPLKIHEILVCSEANIQTMPWSSIKMRQARLMNKQLDQNEKQ